MGLEAINFFFRSEEPIKEGLEKNVDFEHQDDKRYVYKKEDQYWIDLELQDLFSLSLRITLCNPQKEVLLALHKLLIFLFSFKGAILIDLTTKEVYKTYDEEVRNMLLSSYIQKKKTFVGMYGNYTAAINSEEFYKRIRGKTNL